MPSIYDAIWGIYRYLSNIKENHNIDSAKMSALILHPVYQQTTSLYAMYIHNYKLIYVVLTFRNINRVLSP